MLRRMMMAGASAPPATYATWNPADSGVSCNFSSGNRVVESGSFGSQVSRANISLSGKRYFECTFTPSGNGVGVGLATSAHALNGTYLGQYASGYGHYLPDNDIYSASGVAYNGSSNSTSPVTVGFAFDSPTGKLWMIVEGGSGFEGGGDPAAGTSPTLTLAGGTYFPACTPWDGARAITINAGQDPFALWTPSGGYSGVD